MSISSVTTMGYSIAGGFTGSVNLLPTLGYGIGEGAVVVTAELAIVGRITLTDSLVGRITLTDSLVGRITLTDSLTGRVPSN